MKQGPNDSGVFSIDNIYVPLKQKEMKEASEQKENWTDEEPSSFSNRRKTSAEWITNQQIGTSAGPSTFEGKKYSSEKLRELTDVADLTKSDKSESVQTRVTNLSEHSSDVLVNDKAPRSSDELRNSTSSCEAFWADVSIPLRSRTLNKAAREICQSRLGYAVHRQAICMILIFVFLANILRIFLVVFSY